jgi:hypothetical protein
MPDVDLTGYYRQLRIICPPAPKAIRQPRPARAPVELVHSPTLDRSQVRGRILAMVAKVDQPQQ